MSNYCGAFRFVTVDEPYRLRITHKRNDWRGPNQIYSWSPVMLKNYAEDWAVFQNISHSDRSDRLVMSIFKCHHSSSILFGNFLFLCVKLLIAKRNASDGLTDLLRPSSNVIIHHQFHLVISFFGALNRRFVKECLGWRQGPSCGTQRRESHTGRVRPVIKMRLNANEVYTPVNPY